MLFGSTRPLMATLTRIPSFHPVYVDGGFDRPAQTIATLRTTAGPRQTAAGRPMHRRPAHRPRDGAQQTVMRNARNRQAPRLSAPTSPPPHHRFPSVQAPPYAPYDWITLPSTLACTPAPVAARSTP